MPGPPFFAGQDLTAAELNAAFPSKAYVAALVSKTSSTTFSDITGLSIPVEANAIYAFDGWLGYNSGATPDLKLQTLIPAGASGTWGIMGLQLTTTGGQGNVNGNRSDMGSGNVQSAAGSDTAPGALACQPRGVLMTGATAGDFKMQFAQNTSNASATSIIAGSWIRLARLA